MKTVTIEDFLSWAFVHELPKGGGEDGLVGLGSAWSAMNGFAELLTVIDRMPDAPQRVVYEQGEPAQDAVEAGLVVAALAGRDIDVPDNWNPFPGWPDPHGLIAAQVAQAVERHRLNASRRDNVVHLVVSAAVLGRGPDWRSTIPKVRIVERGGKPAWFVKRQVRDPFGRMYMAEVDGRNPTTRRPYHGAYRKHELSRSLVGDAMSRLDWQLWVDALGAIAESLQGKLTHHQIAPTRYAREPWKLVRPQTVEIQGSAEGDTLKRAVF